MELPIYNCIIDETEDDQTGIFAISFVDCPANEVDFVALRQDAGKILLNRDSKKQILTGVVLKPDQLIYRNSLELGDYYIRFSAEQIEKIAQKMMRTGVALHNTSHQHRSPLSGNYLTELWIVEDPNTDKSKALGFENLPKGTLMCSYKVEDPAYWEKEIMTGHVKGFSLEGFFNQQPDISKVKQQMNVKMNKRKSRPKQTLLGRIARMLLDIEAVEKADTTASGTPYVVFVLADGKEAYVDQDGFATLDGEQMPAGEHKLANGNLLIVDEQGQFVETRELSENKTQPEEERAPQTLRRKRHRLAEFEPKTAEALKAKIAEMQSTIDQLMQALDEAQAMLEDTKGQVEEMRRKTPSARPAVHLSGSAKHMGDMTTAERMAAALSQTISRRK